MFHSKVLKSAERLCKESKLAMVNIDGIEEFCKKYQPDDILKRIKISGSENGPPVYKFDSPELEINFWFFYGYMQFGHGFRHLLHEDCNRGASKTMTYGIDRMMKNGHKLSAEELKNTKREEIADLFGFQDKGELSELVDQIFLSLSDSGSQLLAKGFTDFADFLRQTYKKDRTCDFLLKNMYDLFPCLRDSGKSPDGKYDIYIVKKANLIISFLSNLEEFEFPDLHEVCGIIDNVVPRVMMAENIVIVDESISKKIGAVQPLSSKEELVYRSACMLATRELSKKMKMKVRDDQISHFLWLRGKEPHLRKLERHYNKKTVFY